MREITASIILICLVVLYGADVNASWLIDLQQFHSSAHGQLSCQDCHRDIIDKGRHPDSADIDKGLEAFFRIEQCIDCHEDSWEDIVAGSHGDSETIDPDEYQLCIDCHNPHYQEGNVNSEASEENRENLPVLSIADRQCLNCHEYLTPETPSAAEKISRLCFHCHGDTADRQSDPINSSLAPIDVVQYESSTHAEVACTQCHLKSTEFKHTDQAMANCRQCHPPHDAKVANAIHLAVDCANCHLQGAVPQKDPKSNRILYHRDKGHAGTGDPHRMVVNKNDETCRSCHYSQNPFGAAAMLLPAKSVVCMPCHSATLSIGDTTTAVGLIIFTLGLLGIGSIWFSGGTRDNRPRSAAGKVIHIAGLVLRTVFSVRIFAVAKALIVDGLLQARLFRISQIRWLMHALVFFPFVLRFGWGLVALAGTVWYPTWSGTWVLVDKNHPLTAFVFDLTGLMVLAGAAGMIFSKRRIRSKNKLTDMPKSDWLAYVLIGAIIVVGFILEGMRIAMSGSPGGAPYAFAGYAISRIFTATELTDIYGYFWYMHAVLTAVFVAYLPFSRMFHIIMAPLVLAANAGTKATT